ncbi:hypothetical protein LMG28688_01581 [Paraburkholderia caffeinitolerans]|uniref:Uncharacterized protein n=1 Tax=Paraburkholderia caffeinitolerans TaxID=1723730 RepID=A0A6J5FQZ9_9BURK|nr:hypothetical protein [Paraburkholderia caffeinitolerans]CAB3783111.1 hypothetical protein LMG28688_01581 [Paraburkholderia caffeinitolerans]
MRPIPTRLPDELLAKACSHLVDTPPEEALLNPAVRAAVQAAVRAQIVGRPQRHVGRQLTPRSTSLTQTCFAFDDTIVDLKKRAANDGDEE